jgi:hypothetical protein
MQIGISSFFILAIFLNSNGQEVVPNKTIPKLELNLFGGLLAAHHPEMKPLNTPPYLGLDVRMGFQTTGEQYWHQLFKYPIYGVDFYAGSFNNKAIGYPMALFGFMELPFIRKTDSYWSTSWGTGLAFHINEYDSISNPENIAIGTDLNVYIDFSILYKKMISNRLDLGCGIKFQHFSNGAIQYPNLGLNMISGQITIGLIPGKALTDFKTHSPEIIKSKSEYYIFEGIGWNGNPENNDIKYFNNTISLGYNYRINQKRMVGIGTDIFYNEKNETLLQSGDTAEFHDFVSYAGFLSTDLIANRFRMVVQLGFYFYKPVDYGQPFYERVALRYYLVPWAFTNVSIKAHAAKAQLIEWGIGFAF